MKILEDIDKELLACPLCGKQPRFVRGLVYSMIKCECGLNLFAEDGKEGMLIKKWNKRK